MSPAPTPSARRGCAAPKVLLVNPRGDANFWTFGPTLELLGRAAQDLPLGLLTVAALLPESWSLRLVDEHVRPLTQEDWDGADTLFLGGLPSQLPGIFRLIREGRRRGKQVVVGGSAVYHRPDEALEAGADVAVVGEAEAALPALVAAVEEGLRGQVLRDHPVADMAASPPPRLDLVEDLGAYTQAAIQTTRGCPFLCEFCDVTVMNGRRARTKSPAQVLAELDAYREAGWTGDLFFVDDIFNGNPGRARELVGEVADWQRRHGFPFRFRTQCAVTLAKTDDLLAGMADAGFTDVFVGIETPDPAANERTKKFQNSRCDLGSALETIGAAGLSIFGGCIVGIDGEAPGADRRLLDFLDAARVPVLSLAMLYAPPSTDLFKRLEREGRVVWARSGEAAAFRESPLNFVPDRPADEIAGEFVRLNQGFYEPTAYLERLLGHLERTRPAAPMPRLPLGRRDRGAVRRVVGPGAAAAASGPGYVRRLRAFSKARPDRFEQLVSHLLLFEHFSAYAARAEQVADAMLAARAEDVAAAGLAEEVPTPRAALAV